MRLSSGEFAHSGRIPPRFTCDGEDVSPSIAWSEAPAEALSFALVCCDPDAPSGTWYHWAAFDIPAGVDRIDTGLPPDSTQIRQAINDFGKPGYGGPCPPHGHDRHHYHFTLYALDVGQLEVPANARCRAVEAAARRHAIATAEMVGMYGR